MLAIVNVIETVQEFPLSGLAFLHGDVQRLHYRAFCDESEGALSCIIEPIAVQSVDSKAKAHAQSGLVIRIQKILDDRAALAVAIVRFCEGSEELLTLGACRDVECDLGWEVRQITNRLLKCHAIRHPSHLLHGGTLFLDDFCEHVDSQRPVMPDQLIHESLLLDVERLHGSH